MRPIIEIVGLRLVPDRAAMLVTRVLERGRAADHTLTRYAIDLVADRPHEVTTATRGYVVRKSIGLQEAQQLDHRRIRRLEVPARERRMLCGTEESVCLALKVLHADSLVRSEDSARERSHVRVVARVVIGHHLSEPAIVALERRLPGLALLQLRLRVRHRDKTPKNEVELDRHRLLAPQRPIVVEHCDALVDRHGIRHCPVDELDERLSRWAIPPAR